MPEPRLDPPEAREEPSAAGRAADRDDRLYHTVADLSWAELTWMFRAGSRERALWRRLHQKED